MQTDIQTALMLQTDENVPLSVDLIQSNVQLEADSERDRQEPNKETRDNSVRERHADRHTDSTHVVNRRECSAGCDLLQSNVQLEPVQCIMAES